MNIVIVTTDEPFYLPITIHRLVDSKIKQHIKKIILLPPTSKKRTWKTIIYEQLRFGIVYFIFRSLQFLIYKVLSKNDLKFRGRYFSVESIARDYKIPISKIDNINSKEAIELLMNERPDLIISISASQIFSKNVIVLPKYGTINVHNAPLPKYQGLMPSFWVLYNMERQTATTIHFVTEKIDAGDIIVQKIVKINKNETLDSLIKKTKLMTVDALLEAFELFERYNGEPPIKPNRSDEATYFSFPNKSNIKEFKKRGGKLLWKGIY